MTWTPILDILSDLGVATGYSLWLPILAWTALVVPAWGLLSYSSAHPLAQYRLRQVLLAALPIGLIMSAAVDVSGWLAMLQGAFGTEPPGSVRIGLILPISDVTAPTVTPSSSPIWSLTHTVGLATLVVGGGGLVGLGRLVRDLVTHIGFRRSVASTPAPDLQQQVDALRNRLGIQRRVCVLATPHDVVPMTLVGRPTSILLPASLKNRPEALRMTLRHELMHVRRWDDLAHVAERVVTAAFAAIPLVPWLRRSIARYREQTCDAAVLEDKRIRPSTYARLLASFAARGVVPNPVSLSFFESSSTLTQRLRAMNSRDSFPSVRWTSGLAALVLSAITLSVVACSDGIAPTPSAKRSAQKPSARTFELQTVRDSLSAFSPDEIASIQVLNGTAATEASGARSNKGTVKITTHDASASDERRTVTLLAHKLRATAGNPLFELDGETYESLDSIDLPPEEIASIEVVKGAAATDAYGERGTNGVVKITTE